MDALAQLPVGEPRDIGVMMAAYTVAAVLPLAEAASLIAAERETGIRLVGDVPELLYLRGDAIDRPARRGGRSLKPHLPPPWPLFRQAARTASWTRWPYLPLTLLRPNAVALSHNPLLIDVARRSRSRLGFIHGETLLHKARSAGHSASLAAADAVAGILADKVLRSVVLPDDLHARLGALVEDQCAWFAAEAGGDLAALRRARLPRHVWAGTGGYWPVRAISLEVLRRDGTVNRFDHGGGTGLNRYRNSWALSDLSVSNRFYVATAPQAARLAASGALDLLAPAAGTQVASGVGDPLCAAVPMRRAARTSSRRSVLFGPGPLLGFRQLVPALLPDPVALDWQLRLVALLKALPVDLICRPHPEGLLRGQRHPVADLIPPATEPFEALVPRTDVFVFDYVQSTTFYEAVCTDRPIVLLQMGRPAYAGEMAEAIARRCRVVPVRFDADNLPQVDRDVLESAVCDGPGEVDPGFFRGLIMGA